MPFYYHANRSATTNATPTTENACDLLLLSGATMGCAIVAVNVNARAPSGTSLAGAAVNWKRCSTAGSGGAALTTFGKGHPDFPAKSTTITTGATPGGTPLQQRTVGCAAPGGAGGWMAIEPDDAMSLKAAGGANGNIESSTIAGLASIVMDYTFDFRETN